MECFSKFEYRTRLRAGIKLFVAERENKTSGQSGEIADSFPDTPYSDSASSPLISQILKIPRLRRSVCVRKPNAKKGNIANSYPMGMTSFGRNTTSPHPLLRQRPLLLLRTRPYRPPNSGHKLIDTTSCRILMQWAFHLIPACWHRARPKFTKFHKARSRRLRCAA